MGSTFDVCCPPTEEQENPHLVVPPANTGDDSEGETVVVIEAVAQKDLAPIDLKGKDNY